HVSTVTSANTSNRQSICKLTLLTQHPRDWKYNNPRGRSYFRFFGIIERRSLISDLRVHFFFFSSRRRHTRFDCDWSSDVCSSDLHPPGPAGMARSSQLLIGLCLTATLWLRDAGAQPADDFYLGRRELTLITSGATGGG